MQGIFQKENTDKALKYGIYRHLPTYEKIIRNLVSFFQTHYPIINRVSELKVHIELTRFVQPEKIEIDANERAVNEKSQYCFFVCTTFDSFLNDLLLNFCIQIIP